MLSPRIFQSNYLPMSFCLGWIRGTAEVRLLRVDSFFVGSIIRLWCTLYFVYQSILYWQFVDDRSGAPTVVKP